MREQLHHFLKMSFKLIWWYFEAVLSEDVVSVSCKNLSNSELANLEVQELFESLLALDFEGSVAFEAVLDNVDVLIKHLNKLVNNA